MITGKLDVTDMKKNARNYAENELDFYKNMLNLSELMNSIKYRSDGKKEAVEQILKEENKSYIKFKKKLYWLFKLGII